jgi:DNA-binding FrmR family transcriptional regulator
MNEKKKKIIIALKKARSSIDNTLMNIEDPKKDDVCFDAIQQNLAVIGLLKSANITMLEGHLDNHIMAMRTLSRQEKQKMQNFRDEVMRIIKIAQDK